MMRQLDNRMFVAGQILPDQMPALARSGVTLIINNRPDDEEPGQPTADDVRQAAEAAGLAYLHLPVAGGFSQAQVEATAAALDTAGGPVLAFCRSGTRSAFLWALAQASRGADADTLMAKAGAAGYDLSPIRPLLG